MNPVLEAKNISKYYKGPAGSKQVIFENINFSINEENSITSILTPFGWGKSTLLRMLSGIDRDYTGEILLNGNIINKKLPFIPENPVSLPWLDVIDNVRLVNSLRLKRDQLSINALQDLIDLVGLTGYEDHYPFNKSYGFRFRITLARALVISPQIILLDDSLKLMDFETKTEVFGLITKISLARKIKFILASSNITEVDSISDKIIFMNKKPGSTAREILNNKQGLGTFKKEIMELLLDGKVSNTSNYAI
ncbi:MAG: ATP-binding cassette domain-containing protein [Ignavibacteriaceae bacterium]|nr:ATP-binding cassette domain-containing protein [Ignavibacteriaceae bacterium]